MFRTQSHSRACCLLEDKLETAQNVPLGPVHVCPLVLVLGQVDVRILAHDPESVHSPAHAHGLFPGEDHNLVLVSARAHVCRFVQEV